MTTKFCEDCIHYRESLFERIFFGKDKARRWSQCAAISAARDKGLPMISRTPPKKELAMCSLERDPSYDEINKCGSTGKLFQRKGEPAPVNSPDPPKQAAMKDVTVLPFRVVPYSSRKEDLN